MQKVILFGILLGQLVASCYGIEMSVTCDNEFTAYADGTFVGSDNNWETAHEYTIPVNTVVVAVYAVNQKAGYDGLLVSFDTGVVSDSSWRCAPVSSDPDTEYPGWTDPSYNDAAWENAAERGTNGDGPWNQVSSISSNAKWIWTPEANLNIICRVNVMKRCLLSQLPSGLDWSYTVTPTALPNGDLYFSDSDSVYGTCTVCDYSSAQNFPVVCNGDTWSAFPTDCSDQISVGMTVDNEFVAYADGVQFGADTNWYSGHTYLLPYTTEVVAIYAIDRGVVPGIVAEFSTGVVTDASWRCAVVQSDPDVEYPGWQNADYDDSGSSWGPARVLAQYGTAIWGTQGDVQNHVSSNASWIWTQDDTAVNAICRTSPVRCLRIALPKDDRDFDLAQFQQLPGEDGYYYVGVCTSLSSGCVDNYQTTYTCRRDGTWSESTIECGIPKCQCITV